jgi:hypothetical protein
MLEYHEGTGDLVSASFDTTVRVWKLMSNVKLKVARQPSEEVKEVKASR